MSFLFSLISSAKDFLRDSTAKTDGSSSSSNITFIGIHVRRTDYKTMVPLVGAEFFLRAILKLEQLLADTMVAEEPQVMDNSVLKYLYT